MPGFWHVIFTTNKSAFFVGGPYHLNSAISRGRIRNTVPPFMSLKTFECRIWDRNCPNPIVMSILKIEMWFANKLASPSIAPHHHVLLWICVVCHLLQERAAHVWWILPSQSLVAGNVTVQCGFCRCQFVWNEDGYAPKLPIRWENANQLLNVGVPSVQTNLCWEHPSTNEPCRSDRTAWSLDSILANNCWCQPPADTIGSWTPNSPSTW